MGVVSRGGWRLTRGAIRERSGSDQGAIRGAWGTREPPRVGAAGLPPRAAARRSVVPADQTQLLRLQPGSVSIMCQPLQRLEHVLRRWVECSLLPAIVRRPT